MGAFSVAGTEREKKNHVDDDSLGRKKEFKRKNLVRRQWQFRVKEKEKKKKNLVHRRRQFRAEKNFKK
jgi:hypothetical protein